MKSCLTTNAPCLTTNDPCLMTHASLTIHHAPAGYRLSTQAGWNQTLADWKLMLELGNGYGIFADGELIATTLYLPYRPIAWIGMVLVDVRFRRRGLATRLMERCLDDIASEGLYPMLDATEAGSQVYRKFGFEAFATITRFEGQAKPSSSQPPNAHSIRQLKEIQALDTSTFGGDRREMIEIWIEHHASSYFLEIQIPVQNFGFVRPGRQAWHIGPLLTQDINTAMNIISVLLAHRTGQVIIDVPDHQSHLQAKLKEHGFLEERKFFRMATRNRSPLDIRLRSIAGPEWG